MVINDIRNYETTFIVSPDLEQGSYDDTVAKFNKLIQDNGGQIVNQERWGMRKLAYEIGGHNTGYYVFTEFRSTGDIVATLDREYEYDEKVIRHLTIRLEKYAAEWNEKRRSKLKNQQQAA